MQLQKDLAKVEEANIHVVAISYDKQSVLDSFAKKKNITFPLLSDPDSEVIEAYGVLNDENPDRKIAHPTTFIVGTDGMIAAKITMGGFRERHTADELLEAVERLSAEEGQDAGPDGPTVHPPQENR